MNACLSTLGQKVRLRRRWTAELDSILEQGYKNGLVDRQETIKRIQALTVWPRQACWDRARKLGLSKKRASKCRRWTSVEDQLLVSLAGTRTVRVISEKLNRSVPSVRIRLKRLHVMSGRVRDGLTKIDLAETLGCSRKTIRQWIHQGWLKGRYDGRLQGHDTIRVSEIDLLDFWRSHPEEIPFHRWKREGIEWFLGLLSELTVIKTSERPSSRQRRTIYFTDDQTVSQPSASGGGDRKRTARDIVVGEI